MTIIATLKGTIFMKAILMKISGCVNLCVDMGRERFTRQGVEKDILFPIGKRKVMTRQTEIMAVTLVMCVNVAIKREEIHEEWESGIQPCHKKIVSVKKTAVESINEVVLMGAVDYSPKNKVQLNELKVVATPPRVTSLKSIQVQIV
uniref:Uncharacterized protein n=1 Tax=Cacopsylla melanoneura TaxID=428564 RepID=A0A8D9A7F0_9HEMI